MTLTVYKMTLAEMPVGIMAAKKFSGGGGGQMTENREVEFIHQQCHNSQINVRFYLFFNKDFDKLAP